MSYEIVDTRKGGDGCIALMLESIDAVIHPSGFQAKERVRVLRGADGEWKIGEQYVHVDGEWHRK